MAIEAEVRLRRIDGQLAQAGWSFERKNLEKEFSLPRATQSSHVLETPATYGDEPQRRRDERADYVLKDHDGKPIAIVEAKRDERDPLEGMQQVADYADRFSSLYNTEPTIFLTNGDVHMLWERSDGYAPRKLDQFLAPEDIERRAFLRLYRKPPDNIRINSAIVDRPYQQEAIRHLTQAIEQKRRKFLIVMATGTGKTRTIIALVDLLMRAGWAQRILFLTDRDVLVRQTLGEFKVHLSDQPRTRIEGGTVDHTATIHIATYPSMMRVLAQLSVGYYDLLIADESHRTIYNHYKDIFTHFDALQLGLTATPTDYIGHNTYELFDCVDNKPTYEYSYQQAIQDKWLVGFEARAAETNFQVKGIKADQLPADQQQYLRDQHIDLEDVDFEGSDLERRVTNRGTNDTLVREFMEKCRKDTAGTLPAKSIMFAVSHHHALELQKSFHRLYPGNPLLARVIDSLMERSSQLLDDFKYKDMPRVAISVDMLDTGVDVPAIQNLVFAKPVFSFVKFWQMIGRGTRRWHDPFTGAEKQNFLVLDHWRNFDFFKLNSEGETPSLTTPLPVSLFRLRLDTLALLLDERQNVAAAQLIEQLQQMLAEIPLENSDVRPYRVRLERLIQNISAWEPFTAQVDQLKQTIAPLLRFVPEVNLATIAFDIQVEQLAQAYLSLDTKRIHKLRVHIQNMLRQIPTGLPQMTALSSQLAFILSDGFWEHLTFERIEQLRTDFIPVARFRQSEHKPMLTLNLPDSILTRRWIVYGPGGEGAFIENYRQQVEAHIKDLAEQLPSLYKLKHTPMEQPRSEDLRVITDTLNRPDLFITEEILRQVYERSDVGLLDFIRHILGLRPLLTHEEQVKAAFDTFLKEHSHFTVTQVDFVLAIRATILRKMQQNNTPQERKPPSPLSPADLDRAPFTRISPVHRLFSAEEITQLVAFANMQVA